MTATYSGNGDMPSCAIRIYHRNTEMAESISKSVAEVIPPRSASFSLFTAIDELDVGSAKSTAAITIIELYEDTEPFLQRALVGGERIICWDDSQFPDLRLSASMLVAGVKAVITRSNMPRLQGVVVRQLEEVGAEKNRRQTLLDLGLRRGLMGHSPALLRVLQHIQVVSQCREAPVLLYGKSGTGKELVAKAIHKESATHSQGPFMAVNCGTMRGDLVRSELFGSKKGAYTGSIGDRDGFFKAASGGTIFLDDIQALDAITQAMLLRAVQEKQIVPVGSNEIIPIGDVRIIAATNESLDLLVKTGHFREDLYYRLNVLQIQLPLLRERVEDVHLLARAFLLRYAEVFKSKAKSLSPDLLRAFEALPWSGNVRELENVIQSAVIHYRGSGTLQLEDLNQQTLTIIAKGGMLDIEGGASMATIAEATEVRIHQALQQSGGHRGRAAETLGISTRTLQRRLKKMSIVAPE